jgi:hypothetical protein
VTAGPGEQEKQSCKKQPRIGKAEGQHSMRNKAQGQEGRAENSDTVERERIEHRDPDYRMSTRIQSREPLRPTKRNHVRYSLEEVRGM